MSYSCAGVLWAAGSRPARGKGSTVGGDGRYVECPTVHCRSLAAEPRWVDNLGLIPFLTGYFVILETLLCNQENWQLGINPIFNPLDFLSFRRLAPLIDSIDSLGLIPFLTGYFVIWKPCSVIRRIDNLGLILFLIQQTLDDLLRNRCWQHGINPYPNWVPEWSFIICLTPYNCK